MTGGELDVSPVGLSILATSDAGVVVFCVVGPAKLKVKSYAVAVTDARRCSPFDNAFLFYIM